MTDTNKNPPYPLKSNQSFTLDLCDARCQLVLNYRNVQQRSGPLHEKPDEQEVKNAWINRLEDPIRKELISILESIDEIDDYGVRDFLVHNIPSFKLDGLQKKRHNLIRIDIPYIVEYVIKAGETETLIKTTIEFVQDQNPAIKDKLEQLLIRSKNEEDNKKRISQPTMRSRY